MDFKVIKALAANQGKEMALATIVKTSGSTPRHEGTKMLVFKDGSFVGTVGGGSGEQRIYEACLKVIGNKASEYNKITLNDDIAMQEGMICGGNMDTFIEYIRDMEPFERAISLVKEKKTGIMVTPQSEPGKKSIYSKEGELIFGEDIIRDKDIFTDIISTGKLKIDGDFIIEPIIPAEKLVVVGGGHCAKPIVRMGKELEFQVILLEDREIFANKERFPDADEIICAEYEDALDQVEFDASTYVVLVTRGHTWDAMCLRKILPQDFKYIGMMGSKKRIITLLNNLEAEGISRHLLDRVNAPVGLDIGAETPEEIAISIMGEIIAVRRNRIQNFD